MTDATPGASLPGARKPRDKTETRPTGANPTTNSLSEAVHGFVLPEAIEKYQDGVQLPIHLFTPVDITTDPMTYQMKVVPGGTPKWVVDAVVDDSDKIILTVPAGKLVVPVLVVASFKTTATAGTRKLLCSIGDGTGILMTYVGGNNNENASTENIVVWSFGTTMSGTVGAGYGYLYDGTVTDTASNMTSYPSITLLAGYTIRVWDVGVVDAAADDLTVVLHYIQYDA
jgi:hypothetical protein